MTEHERFTFDHKKKKPIHHDKCSDIAIPVFLTIFFFAPLTFFFFLFSSSPFHFKVTNANFRFTFTKPPFSSFFFFLFLKPKRLSTPIFFFFYKTLLILSHSHSHSHHHFPDNNPTSIMLKLALAAVLSTAVEGLDRYPVFWNVQQNKDPAVPVQQYKILPRNYTQVGNSCSTPGCSGWTQGAFPTIADDGTTTNGGVPQRANLTLHIDTLRNTIDSWMPDANWTGNAVFDFEAWTPIYEDNADSGNWHGHRYQTLSEQLVQADHPTWNATQVAAQAATEFEAAALHFFQITLQTAKSLRPHAKWGFYGLPDQAHGPCTEVSGVLQCGYNDPTAGEALRKKNDRLAPVWEASTGIFPSIYVPDNTSDVVADAYVREIVGEGLRVALLSAEPRCPVYPYMWMYYHGGKVLLSDGALNSSVASSYNTGAEGLVIWGSSNTNWDYFQNTAGPLIEKVVDGVNECAGKSCSGHGRCVTEMGGGCICDPGYSGPQCEAH